MRIQRGQVRVGRADATIQQHHHLETGPSIELNGGFSDDDRRFGDFSASFRSGLKHEEYGDIIMIIGVGFSDHSTLWSLNVAMENHHFLEADHQKSAINVPFSSIFHN